ncbi:MAG: hypothetical protein IKX57_00645 [Oscillospiraceae bacterium]|nr:hypothetical protein [Oscillospiraceae bacterium]
MKYSGYVLHTAKTLWKALVGIIAGSAVLGALFGLYAMSKGSDPFLKPFLLFLIAGIIISIALPMLIASALKKEEPLHEILEQKGYCDEYLQTFDRIYPQPTSTNKLRKADLLNTMRRFDEAEQLLSTVSPVGLSDDRKMEYHNCRLDLFLSTHRLAEAKQELASCRGFMDIYANAHPVQSIPYKLNAAVILAAADDFENSERYLKSAEQATASLKDQSPVMVMIAKTMQLYALGFDTQAEQQAELTRQEITNSPALNKSWQKEHFLTMLSRAAEFAPQNEAKE